MTKEEKSIPGIVPAFILLVVVLLYTKNMGYAVFAGLVSWLFFKPTSLSFKKKA